MFKHVDTIQEVKTIIEQNSSNVAFIVGNGINRYNNDNALSWDELLVKLWNGTQNDCKKHVFDGVSFTEFYDILEMRCKVDVLREKEIFGYPMVSITKCLEIQKNAFINSNFFDNYPSWLRKKTLADLDLSLQQAKLSDAKYNLQQYIASELEQRPDNIQVGPFVQKAIDLNAPILTTNYDNTLERFIRDKISLGKLGDDKFTSYYPWSSYYSTQSISSPLYGFAIWHINGMIKYPRSIILGLSQYMGAVARARKWIQGSSGEELFNGKNSINWKGRNTWLHIIFNKKLFIFGLALNENETFLRWLLVQRAKYMKMYRNNTRETGWYIAKKGEFDKQPGKRFFLENVGFRIITLPSYKNIYVDIWNK